MPIDVVKIGLGKNDGYKAEFSILEGKHRRLDTDPAPDSPYFYDVIVIQALKDRYGGEVYHLMNDNLPPDRRMKIPRASLNRQRRLYEHILPGDTTEVKDYIYDESGKKIYELQFSAPRYIPRDIA